MVLPKVVIVGAGVTGSILGGLVKEMGLPVTIIEKSRGAGGRMSTQRFRRGGRDTPVLGRADLGAQYVTTRSTPDHSVLAPLYRRLTDAKVLTPFTGVVAGPNPYGGQTDGIRHFTSPTGLQSISEHFLSEVPVEYGKPVADLSVGEDGAVSINGETLGEAGAPSIVVLTQPVNQVLGESKFPVTGNFLEKTAPNVLKELQQVQYSSRFAMAFAFDSAKLKWPYDWAAHYFGEGDVRYVAHDTGKRNAQEELFTVLVHSGVPLAMELPDEVEPFENAVARLKADLSKKLPDIPWGEAEDVKVMKWKYSQVYKGLGARRPKPDWIWKDGASEADLGGFPGCVQLFRSPLGLGLLAGDAMAPASNFEGCVFSALRTAEAIKAFASEISGPSKADL
eukprot:TRINITY_DN13016_c2_g2_i13.p1 TRINITY_DN13016_c2_g2~~TRINITY_DN13016_c2_g2_i13.p1  ORF type:complete len:393 (+),score=78.88 TRINITY_DN13016_c2_g2_i13:104-1282(+)